MKEWSADRLLNKHDVDLYLLPSAELYELRNVYVEALNGINTRLNKRSVHYTERDNISKSLMYLKRMIRVVDEVNIVKAINTLDDLQEKFSSIQQEKMSLEISTRKQGVPIESEDDPRLENYNTLRDIENLLERRKFELESQIKNRPTDEQ